MWFLSRNPAKVHWSENEIFYAAFGKAVNLFLDLSRGGFFSGDLLWFPSSFF